MRWSDPEAPRTVRVGAALMLVAVALAFVREVTTHWSGAGANPGIWAGVIAPIVGLSVGVIWARGIAHMGGIYYWCWVAMVSAVSIALVMLGSLSWAGQLGPWRSVSWTPMSMLEVACVLVSSVLLLSKPSIIAFWKRGSTGANSRNVV